MIANKIARKTKRKVLFYYSILPPPFYSNRKGFAFLSINYSQRKC